jgi:hypothetical protein
MRVRLALCVALLLLPVADTAASAPGPIKHPPTLLWQSYPLNQRSSAAKQRPFRPPALAAEIPSTKGKGFSSQIVLLALLGGALLALAALTNLFRNAFASAHPARRAGQPKPEEKPEPKARPRPDLLVALRPTPVAKEPELEVSALAAARQVSAEREEEADQERSAEPEPPPLRAIPFPLLRPVAELGGEERPATAEGLPSSALPHPEQDDDRREADARKAAESDPAGSRLERELDEEPETAPDPWQKHRRRRAPPDKEALTLVESCRISLWRGYFKYQLYAARGQGGIDRAFALSSYFRLADGNTPSAKASAALRALLDQLEEEGWSVSNEGRRWYEFTLERPRGD